MLRRVDDVPEMKRPATPLPGRQGREQAAAAAGQTAAAAVVLRMDE